MSVVPPFSISQKIRGCIIMVYCGWLFLSFTTKIYKVNGLSSNYSIASGGFASVPISFPQKLQRSPKIVVKLLEGAI